MSIQKMVRDLAEKAKAAAHTLPLLSTGQKNRCLSAMAEALGKKARIILKENKKDLTLAEQAGHSRAFLDRLQLTEKTLAEMARGCGKWSNCPIRSERSPACGFGLTVCRWGGCASLWGSSVLFMKPGPM